MSVDVYLYVDRETWIHRLDPRPKFLAVIGIILLAVGGDHPALPAALQLLGLVAIHVAGAWGSLARVRVILTAIFTVTVLIWIFFSSGPTHLVGPIQVESLMFGVATAFKLTASITASVAWLSTTRNEEIALGFVKLGMPHRMAFAFSAALRMVPTFVGAGMTIVQAQKARGLDVDAGGPIRRMRTYLPLVVPVFASALRSASHQAMALEARGFGAQKERTQFLQLSMRPRDWVLAVLAVAAMVLGLWIYFTAGLRIEGLVR